MNPIEQAIDALKHLGEWTVNNCTGWDNEAYRKSVDAITALQSMRGEARKDYIRRLIAGVRRSMERDPDTIKARNEMGDEVTIGRWVDASILCDVVEQDVLSTTPAQPQVPDTKTGADLCQQQEPKP
jgi:hypothetical protein